LQIMASFSFATENLPQLAASNPVFMSAWAKFKESLANPEIIRCFALHFDPPANYKSDDPVVKAPIISVAKATEIQVWLQSLSLIIELADLPTMYARYNHTRDIIELNTSLFVACSTATGDVANRFAFIVWRKLLHELAHRVLYLRKLKQNAALDGHMTPPGIFCGESGNTFEYLMNRGVFNHKGKGFSSCSEVHVQPTLHPISLQVPDVWISNFFNHSIHQDNLASFQVSFDWPVVNPPIKKRKRAMYFESEEYEVEPESHNVAIGLCICWATVNPLWTLLRAFCWKRCSQQLEIDLKIVCCCAGCCVRHTIA